MTPQLSKDLESEEEIRKQLARLFISYHFGELPITNAVDAAVDLIQHEQEEAVDGFHAFIIGKNIIQKEKDQAFNYARLHRAIDTYKAELSTTKEKGSK